VRRPWDLSLIQMSGAQRCAGLADEFDRGTSVEASDR
jgi:hypothetical protein